MKEKVFKPMSGWPMLLVLAVLFAAIPVLLFLNLPFIIPVVAVPAAIISIGFASIEPNNYRVCTLFGEYVGTVKNEGFVWMNPFYKKVNISIRANSLHTETIKVNDKQGNPIMIAAVVVWKVDDSYKASFEVENYRGFVQTQSEAAIRKLAASYSYDNNEDECASVTLRGSSEEINTILEKEIAERAQMAGIVIVEARISHLAYASEIAGAMLQRQQASAVIAARTLIVEGAVGMVEMALEKINQKELAQLNQEQKAQMVSNLLVVLCSEKQVSPVISAS